MLRFEGAMQARLLGSGILAVEFAGGPDRWADIVASMTCAISVNDRRRSKNACTAISLAAFNAMAALPPSRSAR